MEWRNDFFKALLSSNTMPLTNRPQIMVDTERPIIIVRSDLTVNDHIIMAIYMRKLSIVMVVAASILSPGQASVIRMLTLLVSK